MDGKLQSIIESINNKSKIKECGYLILFKTVDIESYGTMNDWWYTNDIEKFKDIIDIAPDSIEKIIKL